MNRKQLINQIRNLSHAQCDQLGVSAPFKGQASLKMVEAWLGDATLLDADGNALELENIFADSDPAEVTLHSGMPAEEEAEEATEEAVEVEVAPEADMEAMIKRSVQSAMGKSTRLALPRTSVSITSDAKKSKQFGTGYDQHLAGQWIGAKLLNIPTAQKWWNSNGIKAQNEGTNSAGGYLVPDPLQDAIIRVRQDAGTCRATAQVYPMSSDTLNVPTFTSGSTVSYPNEGSAITESSAVWGSANLVSVKRACLMKWSNELGSDSAGLFDLAGVLSEYMGEALAVEEDNCFINGDGTSTYGSVTGLKNKAHSFVTGAGTTWSDLTLANLASTVGTLGDKYHRRASWIMSRQFFSQVVLRVIAGAGGNTIDSLGMGATGSQLLGYPVFFSDQAPTTTAVDIDSCYFGDWAGGVVFGDRNGIDIATSEHINFAEDQVNIRATSRYDIQVHDGSAFVALATASS